MISAVEVSTLASTVVSVDPEEVALVKSAIEQGLAAVDDTVYAENPARPQDNAYQHAYAIRNALGLDKNDVRIKTTQVEGGYTWAIVPR